MKPKKYEIANYIAMGDKTLNEIKRDFKAQTIITAILVILALIICFMSWDTAVKYEALKKDKQALDNEKKFNWLNRFMMKIIFGWEVKNL